MKKVLRVSILFFIALCAGSIIGIIGITLSKFDFILTTNPPPVYMVKNLEEQMECAKKAGFVIKKPTLRVIKQPYISGSPHGFADMYFSIITLVHFASYITLAHELGHIIDAQTGRKGHKFFVGKENWDDQRLADAIRDVILEKCRSV